MPADNATQQTEVLTETYRLLLAEGDMTRADLKAKVIAVGNEGGSQSAVAL
jgi:hypothetical protein